MELLVKQILPRDLTIILKKSYKEILSKIEISLKKFKNPKDVGHEDYRNILKCVVDNDKDNSHQGILFDWKEYFLVIWWSWSDSISLTKYFITRSSNGVKSGLYVMFHQLLFKLSKFLRFRRISVNMSSDIQNCCSTLKLESITK